MTRSATTSTVSGRLSRRSSSSTTTGMISAVSDLVGRFADRAAQAEVGEERRAELAEVGANAAELAGEDFARAA